MATMFPCAFSPWSPGIGDAHPLGWLIAALYVVAAAACAVVAHRAPLPLQTRKQEQLFWWLCAIFLAVLAINKQLDLQTLLTSVARCVALDQGWYDDRRIVQRGFIAAVSAGGVLVVVACGLVLRNTFARTGLAIFGLGFVSTFVAIRAASFHHVDTLINGWVLGLRITWVFETAGPLLILVAAFRARGYRPS